jgi:hypothetical protein
MKKSIDCLLGIAMIILSVAINSFIWIYNALVNLTFFIDYFLTIRGFIYIETPIFVAYGVAWKINLYMTNKMNGHIFAPEHCLKEIAQSAKKIFKQELNIEFNDKADIHVN